MAETLTGGTVQRPYKLHDACTQLASKLYEGARKSPSKVSSSYIQPLLAGTTGITRRRRIKTIHRKVKRQIQKIAILPNDEFTVRICNKPVSDDPKGFLTPIMTLILHDMDQN